MKSTHVFRRGAAISGAAIAAGAIVLGTAGLAGAAGSPSPNRGSTSTTVSGAPSGPAGAGTAHSGPGSGTGPGQGSGPGGSGTGGPPPHPPCPHDQACVGGEVLSVNGTGTLLTVVVSDRDGFWRTIQTSASTTYTQVSAPLQTSSRAGTGSASPPVAPPGTPTTASAVSVGSYIGATGAVDANHTTLDATSVTVLPPPPTNTATPGGSGSGDTTPGS